MKVSWSATFLFAEMIFSFLGYLLKATHMYSVVRSILGLTVLKNIRVALSRVFAENYKCVNPWDCERVLLL